MILASTAAATAIALASPALAQDTFATKGDFAFAADRLTGIYLFDQGNYESTVFGLLQTPTGVNSLQMTRVGFDWFPIARLSIGGSLSYWSTKSDLDGDGPSPSVTVKELMIAPRVGYAIPITRAFGFWPRGGITYLNNKQGGANSTGEWAFTFEAQFYASPASHFAFIFGPVLDLGFAGDANERPHNFGLLTGGILGWI
jgi:hypothetical protein